MYSVTPEIRDYKTEKEAADGATSWRASPDLGRGTGSVIYFLNVPSCQELVAKWNVFLFFFGLIPVILPRPFISFCDLSKGSNLQINTHTHTYTLTTCM